MSDGVMLDWMVPKDEWERFREYVYDEYGTRDGVLGFRAGDAIREYADADDHGVELEEAVHEVIEGAGLTPRQQDEKRKTLTSTLAQQETTRVTVRVSQEEKDMLREVARDDDNRVGVVFGKAINRYRDGGRKGKNARKVQRLIDNTIGTKTLAAANPDTDETLTAKEKEVRAIADEVGEAFYDYELTEVVKKHAGNSPDPARKTVTGTREMVIDHLGVEPHPNPDTDAWLPPQAAEDVAPDGLPRVSRLPVDMLDDTELVGRVQIETAYYAVRYGSDGTENIPFSVIQEWILDDELDKDETGSLLARVAADTEVGFEIGIAQGKSVLEVDVPEATSSGTIDGDKLRAYIEDDEVFGLLRQAPIVSGQAQGKQPGAADGGDLF